VRGRRTRWTLAIVGLAAAGLLAGCSSSTRQRLLEIFFDEPPTVEKAQPSSAVPERPRTLRRKALPEPEPVVRYRHPPFEARECGSCHALKGTQSFSRTVLATSIEEKPMRGTGPRLLMPPERLCFECHDDKSPEALREAGATKVHGPVEARECIACHDPHQSPYPKMLKAGPAVADLCLTCHDRSDVMANEVHDEDAIEAGCTSCHDPHAGEEPYMFK
jgi:predicted CXXCH cytochrome family protein